MWFSQQNIYTMILFSVSLFNYAVFFHFFYFKLLGFDQLEGNICDMDMLIVYYPINNKSYIQNENTEPQLSKNAP